MALRFSQVNLDAYKSGWWTDNAGTYAALVADSALWKRYGYEDQERLLSALTAHKNIQMVPVLASVAPVSTANQDARVGEVSLVRFSDMEGVLKVHSPLQASEGTYGYTYTASRRDRSNQDNVVAVAEDGKFRPYAMLDLNSYKPYGSNAVTSFAPRNALRFRDLLYGEYGRQASMLCDETLGIPHERARNGIETVRYADLAWAHLLSVAPGFALIGRGMVGWRTDANTHPVGGWVGGMPTARPWRSEQRKDQPPGVCESMYDRSSLYPQQRSAFDGRIIQATGRDSATAEYRIPTLIVQPMVSTVLLSSLLQDVALIIMSKATAAGVFVSMEDHPYVSDREDLLCRGYDEVSYQDRCTREALYGARARMDSVKRILMDLTEDIWAPMMNTLLSGDWSSSGYTMGGGVIDAYHDSIWLPTHCTATEDARADYVEGCATALLQIMHADILPGSVATKGFTGGPPGIHPGLGNVQLHFGPSALDSSMNKADSGAQHPLALMMVRLHQLWNLLGVIERVTSGMDISAAMLDTVTSPQLDHLIQYLGFRRCSLAMAEDAQFNSCLARVPDFINAEHCLGFSWKV